MKLRHRPLPSLGTVHSLGYFAAILILMLGNIYVFLHYLLLVTFAVPVVGAFRRKGINWKMFSLGSVSLATGFLAYQVLSNGVEGWIFYPFQDEFGFPAIRCNAFSFLVVSLILLPLSAACAIHRLRERLSQEKNSGK